MTPIPPRRRWFQFNLEARMAIILSLGFLLFAIPCAAIWCAYDLGSVMLGFACPGMLMIVFAPYLALRMK
jgi:hypothetical protein